MRSPKDFTRHLAVVTKHCRMMLVNTVTHVELRAVVKAEYDRGPRGGLTFEVTCSGGSDRRGGEGDVGGRVKRGSS